MGRCSSKYTISPRFELSQATVQDAALLKQTGVNTKPNAKQLRGDHDTVSMDHLSRTISSPSVEASNSTIMQHRPRLEKLVFEQFTAVSEPDLIRPGMVKLHVQSPVGVMPPTFPPHLRHRATSRGGVATMYIASKAAGSIESCGILHAHRLLRSVVSPYITNLRHAFQDNHRVYLVVDDSSGFSLKDVLREHRSGVPEETVHVVAASITAALNDLHSRGCCHGALTPSSVVIDGEGRVKLGNFFQSSLRASPQDTMKDWHQLGFLLFRLLTGRAPCKVTRRMVLRHEINVWC